MDEQEFLAEQFQGHRGRLRAVAFRMLGSRSEADDAVQEAWMRLSRSGVSGVENLGAWLTTIVARVSLNMLQSRASRREDVLGEEGAGSATRAGTAGTGELADPEQEALRARQGEIVSAFLAASRGGDFDALLALLDPEVVLRGDHAVARMGGSEEVRGPAAVAGFFRGRAQGAQPALIDGVSGAVWLTHGKPRVVFRFSFSDGRITSIELVGDRERLSRLDVAVLSD